MLRCSHRKAGLLVLGSVDPIVGHLLVVLKFGILLHNENVWSLLAVLVSEFRLCFTLCLFIILLVQFGLLSGHLLGNSCPLG